MREYACGHSDVGDRIHDCDLRRLQNKECNRYIITPETIVETDQCATCKECDTSVHAHHQDSTHPNLVSPSALGFEGRGMLSVEKNSKHLPRLIGERDVPGDGPSWLYEDGTTSKKALVNAQWSVKEGLTPRKPLAIACMDCRMKKIKCDQAKPECGSCAKFGRKCSFPTAGTRNLSVESLKLTEEARKPEQPRCETGNWQ